ncbi:hypothetical protein BJF88_04140 [Cellulosimicrobium sp. CUA-896]|nr:hypothetical protein BJF88_04140 [Cellulosimicrobium sp. CUA-896]
MPHRGDLPLGVGVRRVDDVQEQVASPTSSSVDRNASTSWCGSARTKPTVSASVYTRPSSVRVRRTVGSSVANRAFSTSTPAPVIALSRLDLPALV